MLSMEPNAACIGFCGALVVAPLVLGWMTGEARNSVAALLTDLTVRRGLAQKFRESTRTRWSSEPHPRTPTGSSTPGSGIAPFVTGAAGDPSGTSAGVPF